MLSLLQQKALRWLDDGVNFFNTGGAGCGKSYIVKEIAQSTQISKTIHITASTGNAAYLLNGVTIHAFAGIETAVKACKITQCDDELFGGIQVIACGDFFQLPPVKEEFVFKSKLWQQYMNPVLVLTECFRQKEDAKFFEALNEIRFVDVYNSKKMNDIKDKGRWFYAKDVIKNPNIQFTFQIPAAIHLKINAVVMLVRNINVEEGLCNGTVASRMGLPLRLAFSFTVHKAQGSTMNKVVINFNCNAFNNTLYYVSLSRVCNINDIYIIHNNEEELRKYLITVNSDVKEFYKKYIEHFYFIKDGYKDEDIVKELKLNAEIQNPDEIVYSSNKKH
ncbi:ATP-dependent DNA helicase PIF1-like [Hydra vulgaris]|uniref:ATP-dependent DNA helicase n=1 Tax=Hydra vulgaris TaxID=6087 RepID=A0ABM4BPM5_HYDVU